MTTNAGFRRKLEVNDFLGRKCKHQRLRFSSKFDKNLILGLFWIHFVNLETNDFFFKNRFPPHLLCPKAEISYDGKYDNLRSVRTYVRTNGGTCPTCVQYLCTRLCIVSKEYLFLKRVICPSPLKQQIQYLGWMML